MDKLKIGLVGCGGRGRGHLSCLKEFADVEITALCDVNAEVLKATGEQFSVSNRYTDLDQMLEEVALDAVFVATSVLYNAPTALRCLEKGVNTLLEKPPGMKAEETIALRDAANKTGAKAMVGWNRRFHPIIVQAWKMIKARGEVVQIVGEFHKSMARFEATDRFPEEVMDAMLLETPIHAIDTVRAIAESEVTEVHSIVRRAYSRYRDVHGALVLFENGCVVHLIANYTTDARLERYEIHGRQISAYLEGVSHGLVVCDGKQIDLTETGSSGTQEQNRYFLDCVKNDRFVTLPAANLDEAIKTMELAEAILANRRTPTKTYLTEH